MDEVHSHPRIRLVLLDDNILFRESLARLLVVERDLEVVAQCTIPAESLKVPSPDAVDVLLVRFAVAKDFISCARRDGYGGKFLVIARDIDVKDTAAVLSRGASGVFLESEGPTRLIQAIRLIASGEESFSARPASEPAASWCGSCWKIRPHPFHTPADRFVRAARSQSDG
jgi:DNA-binding NarL/FixJ family response regulator